MKNINSFEREGEGKSEGSDKGTARERDGRWERKIIQRETVT